MAYLLIKHKVEDFSKWKQVFDEHGPMRKAGGSKGGYLFRNADDPNELVIIFKWDDLEKARQFTGSEELKKAMEQAGVVTRPDIYFLDKVEKVSV